MQVVLPEATESAKLILDPPRMLNDDDYYAFCLANPSLRIERNAQGDILIVPPAGGESSFRTGQIYWHLNGWALHDRRGKAFESSAEFVLATGAALSPDASWISNSKLSKLSKEQLKKFPPVCPEFVVEVRSPSDRLKPAKEKMSAWMAAGVELGWLIDADRQTVYIYRAGQADPEKRHGITSLEGEGPVHGFKLDLIAIWEGL